MGPSTSAKKLEFHDKTKPIRNHLCKSQKLQQSITMATSILKATTETHLYDYEKNLNSSFRI
jgi:hypothetical protein